VSRFLVCYTEGGATRLVPLGRDGDRATVRWPDDPGAPGEILRGNAVVLQGVVHVIRVREDDAIPAPGLAATSPKGHRPC
jgi:hypothetical protein